jgi:serine O-acetyltransferase
MHDLSNILADASQALVDSYMQHGGINRRDGKNLPTQRMINKLLHDFMQVLFPGFYGYRISDRAHLLFHVHGAMDSLFQNCTIAFNRALQTECQSETCTEKSCMEWAERCATALLQRLPEIRHQISRDVAAGYDGDPAAKSTEEVILCYPFVFAIAAHRIAHEIYGLDIPLISRMISERAHHHTGIDIHPGAVIGDRFFIDHGTGVVIGETCQIGNDVKIYQGVTLGALSFPRNKDGSVVKGGKRHPTIGNNVTIYAGATILGGETVIGDQCVIGANTWVTESVPANTLVTFQQQQQRQPRRSAAIV